MRCANPQCNAEALYLRSGSIYCVDRPGKHHSRLPEEAMGEEPMDAGQRHIIWLCRKCSERCVVETWRPAGEQIRMQQEAPSRKAAEVFPSPRAAVA